MYPMFVPVPIPVSSTRSVVYPRYYHYQPLQNTVMVGNLPEDFLRLSSTAASSQEEQDRATAIHLQNEIIAQARQPIVGRYEITMVNAFLNKNYGLSRMDPYVRLRIGHHVYETHTVPNGAKNPYWNKTFQIYNLPRGVNSMHVEIYDERTLTDDDLIAWAQIPIPEEVGKGEVVDKWFKLSGKLGEGLEGVIHIILSYVTGPAPMPPPVMMMSGYGAVYPQVPVYTLPPANYPPMQAAYPAASHVQPTQHRPPEIKESDIKQLNEMFPSIEPQAIKSVLEASNGNKEAAINSLLQMQ